MAKDSARALDQAVKDVERLSSRGKMNAANYIRYLRLQEELTVTKELLEDPDILKALRRTDRDLRVGRGSGGKMSVETFDVILSPEAESEVKDDS